MTRPNRFARRGQRLLAALAIGATISITGVTALTSPATAAVTDPVSIDAGLDEPVVEGSTLTRTVAILDGEDAGAVGWSYTVDYGDGSTSSAADTASPSIPLSHLYADGPRLHTVTVTVTDVPGESATDTFTVSVANADPTPVITGNATTDEGAVYSLNLSGTDPAGVNDPLSYYVDWGDGGISAQVFGPGGVRTHVYKDDVDGGLNTSAKTISVAVIDDDGGFAVATFAVAVNNVAPSITLSGAATAEVGVPYTLTLGAIADPGTDTVTSRVIRWGDGTSDTVTTGGDVTHTYAGSGARTIAVDLVDEDGTFPGAGTLPVTVVLKAPTAPTGLTATTLSRSAILLGWTNTSTTQTSLLVERCKGVGCTRFSLIATLSGTATSFTNSGLSPHTTYTYRIRARNAVGYSPYSNTASARTT